MSTQPIQTFYSSIVTIVYCPLVLPNTESCSELHDVALLCRSDLVAFRADLALLPQWIIHSGRQGKETKMHLEYRHKASAKKHPQLFSNSLDECMALCVWMFTRLALLVNTHLFFCLFVFLFKISIDSVIVLQWSPWPLPLCSCCVGCFERLSLHSHQNPGLSTSSPRKVLTCCPYMPLSQVIKCEVWSHSLTCRVLK